MTRVVSALLVGLFAGAVILGMAAPALAHNVLISSDPKDGAALDAGPQTITLTFDQPVNGGEKLNTITVTGPDESRWEAAGEPTIKNNSVTAQVRPLGPVAEYTVSYRILSADGHPVRGSLKFSLTTAGTGTPAPAVEAESTETSATGSVGEMLIWPWILGAVVLLGGGVFLALRGGAKEDDRP